MIRWCLVVAAALLAAPASAHEVDCSKLAAIALTDANGAPILDPSGLPSLAAPAAGALVIDHYPALVAFDERILNLATAPSVLSSVVDTLSSDPSRVLFHGDAFTGPVPLGGVLHRVATVAVRSFEDCLVTFPQDPLASAPVCGRAREDDLVVTTESDIAVCRAHVVCLPQQIGPPPPPPPPPTACTGPTWRGDLKLPLAGVEFAYGDTVGCDGVTWLAGSFADLTAPATPDTGAVFRLDANGQLSLFAVDDSANAVRVDGNGHLDVAGHRRVGTTYGSAVALRQFDAVGTLRWEYDAPDFVSPGTLAAGVDADVDGSSNVYFGYQSSATGRANEISVVKLAPDGQVAWATQVGTAADDQFGSIAVSRDGAVFVSGTTRGAFAGETNASGSNAFVARLDGADGHLVWAHQVGTSGVSSGAGVAVDASGARIALAGTTASALDGGAAPAGLDAFVALFDASGALQWVRELRSTPQGSSVVPVVGASASAAAIDGAGAVWIGGSVSNASLPGVPPTLGGQDGFVARYDAAGTYLWGRQLNEGSPANVTDVAIDAAGFGVASENVRVGLSQRDVHAIRLSPDGT
jgi:hypothetical protein